jgi:hypothetical protein
VLEEVCRCYSFLQKRICFRGPESACVWYRYEGEWEHGKKHGLGHFNLEVCRTLHKTFYMCGDYTETMDACVCKTRITYRIDYAIDMDRTHVMPIAAGYQRLTDISCSICLCDRMGVSMRAASSGTASMATDDYRPPTAMYTKYA